MIAADLARKHRGAIVDGLAADYIGQAASISLARRYLEACDSGPARAAVIV
jgi:hypothetical protein